MTWFKNLTLYKIEHWPITDLDELRPLLEPLEIKDCGPREPMTTGWTPPSDEGDLDYRIGQCIFLRYAKQEKVLPKAVIDEHLKKRLAGFSAQTGTPAPAKMRARLRDEVLMELLPKALVKPSHVNVMIDLQTQWLFINSSSLKVAEDIAALLRRTIDGLKLHIIDSGSRIQSMMTRWLDTHQTPTSLELGMECLLQDPQNTPTKARLTGQCLDGDEIREHLSAGKRASRVEVVFQERLSLVLTEDGQLLKLKPLDIIAERLSDSRGADDEMHAELLIMIEEFRGLIRFMCELFALDVQAAV